MLEMDEGRISFAEALRPPEGYSVAFAVGTTYSLDLRALLGMCIPLGLGFEPEALDAINPVSLFAALNQLQGKLAIYCDKGSMRADVPVNKQTSGLLMLLEGMVHQVNVNWRRKDALSSFHPKVWVVEYRARSRKDSFFRLMVMSRNLTFDTSWDVVVSLDGHPGETNRCSEHVAEFLEFLADGNAQTSTDRDDTRKRGSHTARVRRLAESIRGVEFDIDKSNFSAMDFLSFGPQSEQAVTLMDAHKSDLMTWRWRSVLVVSPFLSGSHDSPLCAMVRHRSGGSGRYVLLSREDSLNELSNEVRASYECFCPAPSLADVELDGEGGVDASNYSNLHAKLYFTQDTGGGRRLWVGSLNASRNGTYNNIEALIVLSVKKGHLSFNQVLKPLIGDGGKDAAPFTPYLPPISVATGAGDDEEFRRAFRIASRLVGFTRVVVRQGEGGASMDVCLEVRSKTKECTGVLLAIRPLLAMDWQDIDIGSKTNKQELSFTALSPEQVSAFFVIRGTDGMGKERECVTVCPHDRFDDAGLSLESRSKQVLDAILKAGDGGLLLYLEHVFNLPEAGYGINDDKHRDSAHATNGQQSIPAGLYERLLDMADTNPEVFKKATRLLDFIPDGMEQKQVEELKRMVATFSKAVR